MSDTKERILNAALRLFARDGFEAVSVSAIAESLGMTKGALYKHYKNKRDIFDSIVGRMFELDSERASEFGVPEGTVETDAAAYKSTSAESLAAFALAQLDFWTEDGFASDFRRMLTLEQYRDAEMAELYRKCVVEGPIEYTADIFRGMAERGEMVQGDTELLAAEFCAPLYLFINLSDLSEDKAKLRGLLTRHIEKFMKETACDAEKTKKRRN